MLYSLCTNDPNTIVKFADDTVVVGPITNNNERAYLHEVSDLTTWSLNSLFFNGGKTKEMVDFCPQRRRSYTHSWTTQTDTEVMKARQRLYHLSQLRRFRVSLDSFYSATIQSILY